MGVVATFMALGGGTASLRIHLPTPARSIAQLRRHFVHTHALFRLQHVWARWIAQLRRHFVLLSPDNKGEQIDSAKDDHPDTVNEVPVHLNRLDSKASLACEITTNCTNKAD